MRVFLTGATGYLGGRLALRLHERGHQVRALVRSPERARRLPDGVIRIYGDLLEPATYRKALATVDAVIHTAALVKVWTRDRRLFDRVNVDATLQLIEEAVRHGVKKFLYTSSFIALGPSPADRPLDETAAGGPPYYNDYHRTKVMALHRVRKMLDRGYPVWILIPGVIYGPGELTDGNHLVQILRDFDQGRLPGYIGSGEQQWNFAWIDDVVMGFLKVLETDPQERTYILGGENCSMRKVLGLAARYLGRPAPRRSIPKTLVKTVAAFQFLSDRVRRRPPRLTPGVVEIYARNWMVSSDRAVRDLGYRITPFAQGLEKTVEWMRNEGLLD